ncbi:hypothetical protein [Undibacterium sp. TJN19]|uniref:hypothetical protein n=1 Tax=Undibacterium sp. TJN19 TaxID=3413055 RepID=UPI003BF07AC9
MSQLRINIIKSLICFFVISALLIVFLHSLVPHISPLHVFPYIALGMFVFACALYLTIILRGGFNQWSINRGAIDPAWLWFNANPPGLEAIKNDVNSAATPFTPDNTCVNVDMSMDCNVTPANSCPAPCADINDN